MTVTHNIRSISQRPAPAAGRSLLLPGTAFIWAGARLTSCGFMAAPAAI